MSLITTDETGKRIDKVERSIERIKAFAPEEGYFLAFSGGKDSVVIKALADLAGGGCKYDAHYNVTTVDPPELVRFIAREFPDVTLDKPDLTMKQLIVKKMMPPTRLIRYCCTELKERGGKGRVIMTGVRWAEGSTRKSRHGLVTAFTGKRALKKIERETDADYQTGNFKGIILNDDNDESRRVVEMCYRTSKTLVNPIIDWDDDDVWEFIKSNKLPYCELYDCGFKRVGCIGCPMGRKKQREFQFERYPARKEYYLQAFKEMIERRKELGHEETKVDWSTPQKVFDWWING